MAETLSLLSGAGSVTVKVIKAENDFYHARSATTVVVCAKADQEIAFTNPGAQFTTNTTLLSATASSGLAVTFEVISGPADLSGSNLTYSADGIVKISASQNGNLNYNAAVTVTQSFAVGKSSQDPLVFEPLSPQVNGATNELITFGGSGTGTVSFAVISGGGAIVDTTKLAMRTGTGEVVVVATKAADDRYSANAATSTVVCALVEQTISFLPIQDQNVTNITSLSAMASSGLEVTFDVVSGPATLTGSTTLVYQTAGTVLVRATQSGDDHFAAAPSVTNMFEVNKIQQAELVFMPAGPQEYGTTNALSTMGGSGTGVVSYSVSSGAGHIVNGNYLTITAGTGSVMIVATKAAEDLYESVSATGIVECAKGGQTIMFVPVSDQETAGKVGLAATASSGLEVTFAVCDGPANIADGTNLSFSATGSVSIVASQIGNDNYLAASDVTNTFIVNESEQEPLIFAPASPQNYGATFQLTTTGGSGDGSVSYFVVSGGGRIIDDIWVEITSGTGNRCVDGDEGRK